MCLAFLLYPALVMGCWYDFHENAFLTPLLLWLFWFLEEKKQGGIWICSLLLVTVKEDAGLYLFAVGLYLLLQKERRRTGAVLMTAGVAAFLATTAYINRFGNGTLSTWRYANLIPAGEMGMGAALKTMILNPGYLLTQLLSEEKIRFLLQMFFPLLFLPLMGKKWSVLSLLLPLFAISLITAYPYQFQVGYQYLFGSGALLIVMVLERMNDLSDGPWKKTVLLVLPIACLFFLMSDELPKYRYYTSQLRSEKELIAQTDEVMEMVPLEASVTASTFLTSHLYRHAELYMLGGDYLPTDYVLIDRRFYQEHIQIEQAYYEHGYEKIMEQGYVIVLQKGEPS